jgi:plasmid stability protein
MATLTIRGIDEEVFEQFKNRAKENERNAEAHARYLIQREAETGILRTAGELLDSMQGQPPPNVSVEAIEEFQRTRGKRSSRP